MMRKITSLAALAAVLYSAWPLGYVVNPDANKSLASNLQAQGQPYAWLFIALDIATGAIVCVIAGYLYGLLRSLPRRQVRLLSVAVAGFATFGILTAVDAVLPLTCAATASHPCGPLFDDPDVITHGIASIGSIWGLTMSIVAIWWLYIQGRKSRRNVRITRAMNLLMFAWFGFAALTFLLIMHNKSSALSQHVFITLCSAWIVAFPVMFAKNVPRSSIRKNLGREAHLARNLRGV